MGIFSKLKKNWTLMRIMRRIEKPDAATNLREQLLSQRSSDTEKAEHDLFELVCNNPGTNTILNHHDATRADIEECYRHLIAMGLGRWIQGNYVAAATIAVEPTLIYLLQSTKSPLPDGWTEKDRWIKITSDLVIYFETGGVGQVRS